MIQFLAALAILHQADLKNRMNRTRTILRIGRIHSFLQIILASTARNLINSVPLTAVTIFAFDLMSLSFLYGLITHEQIQAFFEAEIFLNGEGSVLGPDPVPVSLWTHLRDLVLRKM